MNHNRAKRKAVKKSPEVSCKAGDPITANRSPQNRHLVLWSSVGLLVSVLLGAYYFFWQDDFSANDVAAESVVDVVSLDVHDEPKIRETCSRCHQWPAPDVLPRSKWQETIWEMFNQSGYGRTVKWQVDPESLAKWYEEQSPEKFTYPDIPQDAADSHRSPFTQRISVRASTLEAVVANIRVADLLGDARPEVIACDMLHGKILLGNLAAENPSLSVLAEVANPAHVEVTDLDADGRADLIVANLGSFMALEHNLGSVEWLRQQHDGSFERFTLADGLGRVADVEPTDFDGDGDLDLIVAEFGWHVTGHLLLLENQTTAGGTPQFVTRELDGLHGASHVDVVDLDGDGIRELVVLYSQGHEMVRCYVPQSQGALSIHDLYRAPSPAWGFSGSQIVDLDSDGDLDILLTNGDTFDNAILKPYHGIQWLENRGDLKFTPHRLATLYGAYRAEAADLDGDGDQDVAACTLITPGSRDLQQIGGDLDSLVWFEQTTPRTFIRHRLEADEYHHPTLVLSDYDLDGDVDLLVGNGQLNMSASPTERPCIDVWVNGTSQLLEQPSAESTR